MKFPAWPMSGPWTETWKSWNRNSFVRVEMFSQVQNVREPCGLNGLRTKSSCEMYKTCANMCKKSENMYKLSQVMWAHVKNCQDMSSLVDFSGLQWTQWAVGQAWLRTCRQSWEQVWCLRTWHDADAKPWPVHCLCTLKIPRKHHLNPVHPVAIASERNDMQWRGEVWCNSMQLSQIPQGRTSILQASYNLRTPTDLVTATLTLIRVTSAKLSAFCISTLLKASPLAKAQALPAICL